MKTLRTGLLLILLSGGAAAQVATSTSTTPDLTVIKTTWRRVETNPKLYQTQSGSSADYGARVAVNAARTNEANSRREIGIDTPPPKLLSLPTIPDSPPTFRPWSGFIYEFTVQNTGAKEIRHVVFQYSFTDARTQKEVGRRQYKSKVKIRPGDTAKLVVRTARRPIGTIDAQAGQNQADQSRERVIIQRIKYADGSVWERSAK